MRCIPSSLNSLAQGCCALDPGKVLLPCGGILAPDHDGFFPEFTTDVRASFDEAEPMIDALAKGTGPEAESHVWMNVHLHVRKARRRKRARKH